MIKKAAAAAALGAALGLSAAAALSKKAHIRDGKGLDADMYRAGNKAVFLTNRSPAENASAALKKFVKRSMKKG